MPTFCFHSVSLKTGFMITGMLLLLSSSAVLASDKTDIIRRGKAAYDIHCARCHGADGKGMGPDAVRVPVPPRDLTEGIIKFKTTVQGTPPSDDDFLWILNHGLSQSGMPSFANLGHDTKMSIIEYIRTLSPEYTAGTPEPLKTPKKNVKIDLKKGREVYNMLQCGLCHGDYGRANGTAAGTLFDTWKNPIAPTNLAQGWTYRAGGSAAQVYYRLMAGISGAPMPSYEGAVSDEDAWQLAHYIESLQQRPNWALRAYVKRSANVPATANDSAWQSVEAVDVPLQSVFYDQGRREKTAVDAVRIQSISDGQTLAVRLQWFDATDDRSPTADMMLMALKTSEFPGSGLDNLHTLYTPDSPLIPMLLWKADRPHVVRYAQSNLAGVLSHSLSSAEELSCDAVFDDGQWTLMFRRTLSDVEKNGPVSVGFAAWNGALNQKKHSQSVSRWLPLMFTEKKPLH